MPDLISQCQLLTVEGGDSRRIGRCRMRCPCPSRGAGCIECRGGHNKGRWQLARTCLVPVFSLHKEEPSAAPPPFIQVLCCVRRSDMYVVLAKK